RLLETRKEAITRRVDLPPAVALQLDAGDRMMPLQDSPPLALPDAREMLSRPDDVGEQYRGKHSAGGLLHRSGSVPYGFKVVAMKVVDVSGVVTIRVLNPATGSPSGGGAV